MCWICKGENGDGELSMTDFGSTGPFMLADSQRTDYEYVDHHHGIVPMLARCGYTLVEMLLIDWLHNGPLGCFQRVAGGALICLACEDRSGHHTGQ